MSFEFRDALEAQRQLQIKSYGADPGDLSKEDKIEFIRWNILAAEDELHEALQETSWKPWQTATYFKRDAFVSELVDVFHFLMNMMLVADCEADEFLQKYAEKRSINAQRQEDGYDGVSTKCRMCKRATDDPAVNCTTTACEWDD
jgi:dimeric dUTPase (all-alpha-NTP-PPase superfamily)